MPIDPEFLSSLSRFFSTIVLTALGFLAIPAVALVVGNFKSLLNALKGQIGASRLKQLYAVVKYAVFAAEQAGIAGYLQNVGSIKKEYAIELVKSIAKQHGMGDFQVDAISDMIETVVGQMNVAIGATFEEFFEDDNEGAAEPA
jgi:Bacteriophage holin of superfamily 6 (Holin_LLH)